MEFQLHEVGRLFFSREVDYFSRGTRDRSVAMFAVILLTAFALVDSRNIGEYFS